MEDIKWLEVAIDTTTQELEALSARLTMKMYRRGGVDHEKRPIVQK